MQFTNTFMIGIYEGGIWVHAIYIYKVVCKVDATLVCKVEMYLLLTVGMQSGDVFTFNRWYAKWRCIYFYGQLIKFNGWALIFTITM